MTAVSPPPASGDPEQLQAAPSEGYAAEVLFAYEASPESPRSFSRQTIEFLSNSAGKMWETFKGADLVGKGAMVAAGAATAYVGIKVIEAGISLFRRTWDKVTHLGDTLESGLTGLRDMTKEKLLIALLGVGAVGGLLYGLVRLDWDEIWAEAQQHDGSFMVGFLGATVERIVSGAIGLPGEWWDDLAGRFDFLPSRDELSTLRERGREVVEGARQGAAEVRDNVREGVSEAVDWIQEWDEESGLKALRGRMWGFLDEKFEGWRSSPVMVVLMELDDPSKIMAHLSLDTPEKRSAFLEELRDHAVGAGGVATGSYLLHRLLRTPWAGAITGVNVALYMVFQNEKVDTALVSAFEWLHETAEFVRHQLQVVTTQMGLKPEWLLLQEEGLGVKSLMDYVFEKMEDHPDLTALTLLNGALLSRRVILSVIKEALMFVVHAGAEAIEFVIDHTLTASLILGGGVLTFIERRRLIDDLAWALYPNDFDKRKSFKEDAFGFLDKTEFTRVNQDPSVAEAALVPIYDRLVRDPIEFFSDPNNEFRLYELTRDGHIEWHSLEFGKTVTLGFLGGVNPYNNAVQIEWNMFEAMMDEWAARGVTMDNVHVYVTQAGGLALGGAAIYGAARSGIFILSDFNGSVGQLSRFFKMMVVPVSQEFRQVLKSMVRTSADALTFGQTTEILQGLHLYRVSAELDGIFRVVESGYTALEKGVPTHVSGILDAEAFDPKFHKTPLQTYKANLNRLISHLEEAGSEVTGRASRMVHYADRDFVASLRNILRDVESLADKVSTLEDAYRSGDASQISEAKISVRESLETLRTTYRQSQTRWSRAFHRVQQFVDRGVLRKPVSPLEAGTEGAGPRPLPEFKTELMKTHAPRALELGLAPETLLEIEKLGLNETQLVRFLDDLAEGKVSPHQAYEVLVNSKHTRSAALVRSLEKGAPLAFALAITYGFDHADNKIEFLTHEGPRIVAAFPAMKYADQFVGSKMPHPLLRIGVDLLAGAGAAVGVGAVFDHVVMEPVARRFPNWNNPEALTKARLRDGSYILAMAVPLGPVFDWAETGLEVAGVGDGVSPDEDPLDYLFDTVRRFRGFKEARDSADESPVFIERRLHTAGDFEENAGKSVLKWKEKVARQRARLEEMRAQGADLNDEGYRRVSLKLERLEGELTQLERMRDGLWVQDVQLDIYQRDFFIQMLKESYASIAEEQFPDRGQAFVDSLYSRVGTGQDLVNEADEDIWTYLLDQEDLNGPEGSTYSFRKWIALVAFNQTRRDQMTALGFSPDLPKNYFDRPHDELHPDDTPDDPSAPEEPDISEEAATPQSLAA